MRLCPFLPTDEQGSAIFGRDVVVLSFADFLQLPPLESLRPLRRLVQRFGYDHHEGPDREIRRGCEWGMVAVHRTPWDLGRNHHGLARGNMSSIVPVPGFLEDLDMSSSGYVSSA